MPGKRELVHDLQPSFLLPAHVPVCLQTGAPGSDAIRGVTPVFASSSSSQAATASNYTDAFTSAYDAYNHMFMTAEVLAGGIVAFMGEAMPEGGVETGGGGTAK
ncbi:hypothetical protein [Hoyosella altamirensis]|uniref:Uncharacterized protein n=1 Tax=Hoyosella altamirensis TaxID=616997 RepID=A0A839RT72_9ACTN|nr:hypothetical protein [Hoyosella altamirensis]MBB3040065.1 hypothetical protein [Hoyosella altamirensis]